MNVTVIVAAAGRGTRLSSELPKSVFPINEEGTTMLDYQMSKFLGLGFTTFAVVSPVVLSLLQEEQRVGGEFYIQHKPIGMGDALFVAREAISKSDTVLFSWVDQLGLTSETISRTVGQAQGSLRYVVPCLSRPLPYTGLEWGTNGIIAAYESREGDIVPKDVVSDVGLFGFTSGRKLVTAWDDFCREEKTGAVTREVNFLKFLPWLTSRGWEGVRIEARASDGLSVNTQEELENWRREK
jgi:hypothetical protein